MKIFLRGIKFLIMFAGAMFILLAFDTFSIDAPFIERLFGFFISIIPGVTIMLLVYFLWCKEKTLGTILVILGVVMSFFFGMFEDFPEQLGSIIIIGPIFFGGLLFMIFGNNRKKRKGCKCI